jgi:hypothetical protein
MRELSRIWLRLTHGPHLHEHQDRHDGGGPEDETQQPVTTAEEQQRQQHEGAGKDSYPS